MLGLAGYFTWVSLESLESRGWPHVQGSVTRSHATRTCGAGKGWEPRIVYQYVVDGRVHQGERVGRGTPLCNDDPREVQRWLEGHYPIGKAVDVYYNGAQPDAAFLEPGDIGWIDVVMISAALILSGVMAFAGWRSMQRRERG